MLTKFMMTQAGKSLLSSLGVSLLLLLVACGNAAAPTSSEPSSTTTAVTPEPGTPQGSAPSAQLEAVQNTSPTSVFESVVSKATALPAPTPAPPATAPSPTPKLGVDPTATPTIGPTPEPKNRPSLLQFQGCKRIIGDPNFDVCILSVTPKVMPGGQVNLRMRFMVGRGPARVEVYYPGRDAPVVPIDQDIGLHPEPTWSWEVPKDVAGGEAMVVVTATRLGDTYGHAKTFLVETEDLPPELVILENPTLYVAGEIRVGLVGRPDLPAVPAKLEVYYPGSDEPQVLKELELSLSQDARWFWYFPGTASDGIARVVITASVEGKTLEVTGEIDIGDPPSSIP